MQGPASNAGPRTDPSSDSPESQPALIIVRLETELAVTLSEVQAAPCPELRVLVMLPVLWADVCVPMFLNLCFAEHLLTQHPESPL